MKDELLISKVTKLVNQYDETITPKSIHIDSKESLELDSVDLTNFILDLEKEFNIEIADKDYEKFSNFKVLLKMLKGKNI